MSSGLVIAGEAIDRRGESLRIDRPVSEQFGLDVSEERTKTLGVDDSRVHERLNVLKIPS